MFYDWRFSCYEFQTTIKKNTYLSTTVTDFDKLNQLVANVQKKKYIYIRVYVLIVKIKEEKV